MLFSKGLHPGPGALLFGNRHTRNIAHGAAAAGYLLDLQKHRCAQDDERVRRGRILLQHLAGNGERDCQPIGCQDCHDPKTMNLRITRPALVEAFERQGKIYARPRTRRCVRWFVLSAMWNTISGEATTTFRFPMGHGYSCRKYGGLF
jgi:hypothetical protein